MSWTKEFATKLLTKLPLLGGVFEAQAKSRRAAFTELAFGTIFSTLPIWFFPILASSFINNSPAFSDNVYSSINQGDLYLYSSALVGPLIFAITKNYASWDGDNGSQNASRFGKLTFEFPSGMWFFLISIGICTLAAICFGILRFSNMGLLSAQIKGDNMLTVSIVLYIVSLVCLYAVSVYKNELENFSAQSDPDTTDFVAKWNSRND
jgi:hypothetical protein